MKKDALFQDYLKELRGEEIIWENDDSIPVGFLTYVIDKTGNELYVRELFVVPEYRRTDVATRLALKAESEARIRGCKILAGTLIKGTRGMTESMGAMLSFGFKIHDWDQNKIVMTKEVSK